MYRFHSANIWLWYVTYWGGHNERGRSIPGPQAAYNQGNSNKQLQVQYGRGLYLES